MAARLHVFVVFLVLASGSGRQYDPGDTFSYSYSTTVLLDEPARRARGPIKDVGYQISANVQVSAVWQNPVDVNEKLLQIQLENPQLHVRSRAAPRPDGFVFHASQLSSAAAHPLFVHWVAGRIQAVYSVHKDLPYMVQLKKGLASLFQYQIGDASVEEVDSSGECEVNYRADGSRHVFKTKTNCRRSEQSFRYHPNKVLDVTTTEKRSVEYRLGRTEAIIEEAHAREEHTVAPKQWPGAEAGLYVEQTLILRGTGTGGGASGGSSVEEAVAGWSRQLRQELVQDNILSQADNNVEYCSENCQDFSEALAEQREKLEDAEVSSLRTVAIYLLLLEKARVAPKEMLSKELRNPANKKILPQLLDVMAGAQTPDAHQAAMETLNFRSTFSIDLPERYLWALSLAPHPPEEVLRDVLRRWRSQEIPDARLKQTLVLALGALGKHFAAFADNAHKQVVKEIHKAIWDALDACKDEPCKVVLLRAVRNLGATGDVEMLLDHVVHGERKTAVVAMKALRSLPLEALRGEGVRAVLEEVYFQAGRRYDSTARTIAGDLLVELYPRDVAMVEAMFRGLQDLQSYEVNTFVLGRLRDLATRDEGTRELLRRYEARTDYHRLAQGGKSTYFTRDFYRDVPDGSNSTFSSGLEISAGLLKLVTFDAHMQNSLGSLDYLQVALYTAGLHTYSSKEPDPEDLNDVATAGMELSLLGTQLRPFVFFEGQGELMGHIWSGTASTRTPAIQGTYILHDHVESIPLSNGLLGRITFTGSVSLDLGGQIQTSLWYKTCHSNVDTRAGVVIRGRVSADTPFVQSKIEVTLAAQPQLDIVSDMDFSDKTMMCLQMSQPDFVLKHTVRKAEHIIGQQHRLRKIARRTRPVPGCTYLMNKKNSEFCNIMFKDKS